MAEVEGAYKDTTKASEVVEASYCCQGRCLESLITFASMMQRYPSPFASKRKLVTAYQKLRLY
jgi:hypothetical protein